MLQPEQLGRISASGGQIEVPNNSGYAQFVRELRERGIDQLDVAPARVKPDEIRYLAQDTHWTPDYMAFVAGQVAAHIRETVALRPVDQQPRFRSVEQQVTRVGDLVDMLKMTAGQNVYRPQNVTVKQIVDDRTGKPLEPDPDSNVLLVGDSFTNIYSQSDMGWGIGAGFGEQLAYRLGRPIDVIALNGGGASGARAELARSENAERLGRKQVIVYEFAIRDLAGENWRVVPMITPKAPPPQVPVKEPPVLVTKAEKTREPIPPAPKTPTKLEPAAIAPPAKDPAASAETPVAPAAGAPLVVSVRIVKTSKVPVPGSAPYKDCLTFVKVHVESVESGSYEDSELIAAFWAMKDNVWLPPASYAVGDRMKLTLIPLKKADGQIRSMQRADDLDDYTHQPMYVLREER